MENGILVDEGGEVDEGRRERQCLGKVEMVRRVIGFYMKGIKIVLEFILFKLHQYLSNLGHTFMGPMLGTFIDEP